MSIRLGEIGQIHRPKNSVHNSKSGSGSVSESVSLSSSSSYVYVNVYVNEIEGDCIGP